MLLRCKIEAHNSLINYVVYYKQSEYAVINLFTYTFIEISQRENEKKSGKEFMIIWSDWHNKCGGVGRGGDDYEIKDSDILIQMQSIYDPEKPAFVSN